MLLLIDACLSVMEGPLVKGTLILAYGLIIFRLMCFTVDDIHTKPG